MAGSDALGHPTVTVILHGRHVTIAILSRHNKISIGGSRLTISGALGTVVVVQHHDLTITFIVEIPCRTPHSIGT